MKLFVYGSLMAGGKLHAYLKNAKFIKEHIVFGFALYDIAWFPGAVISDNKKDMIHGEVYEVDKADLIQLDIVESAPNLFHRHKYDDMIIYLYNLDIKNNKQIINGRFDVNI